MVKNKLRIIKFLFVLVSLFLFGGGSLLAQSVSLSLPSNLTAQTGQNVSIPVTVNAGATTVTNFNVKISFASAYLVVDSISYTGAKAQGAIQLINTNDLAVAYSNLSGFTGNGTLFTIKGHTTSTPVSASPITIVSASSSYNSNVPFVISNGAITIAALAVTFPNFAAADTVYKGATIDVPLTLSSSLASQNVVSYSFSFTFDPAVLNFSNTLKTTGTASDVVGVNYSANINNTAGTGSVTVIVPSAISSSLLKLVNLQATVVGKTPTAASTLHFTNLIFNNGTPAASGIDGSVVVSNKAPSLNYAPNPATVGEGSALNLVLTGTDPDGDALTYTATGLPTGGIVAAAFNAATKTLTWTPDYNQSSATPYNVTFKVTDSEGASFTLVVPITVTNTNRVPTALTFIPAQTTYSVNQGSALNITLSGTDADTAIDDTLSYSFTQALSDPSVIPAAALNSKTGVFSWTPAYGSTSGTYSVTFKVADKAGASVTVTKQIVVVALGAYWTATLPATNTVIREGQTKKYQYTLVDPQGTKIQYYLVQPSPSFASIDVNTGLLTLSPKKGDASNILYQLNVTATYGVNSASSLSATTSLIQVTADATPVISVVGAQVVNGTVTVPEETQITFTVNTADADIQDTVKLTNSALPTNATFTQTAAALPVGTFAWKPALGQAGQYSVTFTGTDLSAIAGTSVVNFVITKNNYAPVFTDTLASQSVAAGTQVKYTYKATDKNGDKLTYSVVSPSDATIDANTGALTYTANTPGTIVVKVQVTDGITPVTTQSILTVTGLVISGKITYANTSAKPISGVTVAYKKLGSSTSSQVTSDASGNYSLNELVPATYIITYSKATDDWGSVNSADALAIAIYYAGLGSLDAMQLLAADVNNNGVVNNTDALAILQRYVGQTSSFTKPDWVFKSALRNTVGNVDTLAVTTSVVNNISALATGDVNKSLYLTLAKSAVASIAGSTVKIAPKAAFEIPVTAGMLNDLGSISLKMNYDAQLAKFAGLSYNSKLNNIVYKNNVNEGTVSIAWMSDMKSSVSFNDKDVLFTLKFTATEQFQKGSSFALKLDPSSEMTSINGSSLEKSITAPKIEVSVPEEFSLKQNYPNPFNPSTTIAYDIPVSGRVKLVVMNILGQVVANVFDAVQEAGSYKVQWDASKLSSGTYLYNITVEGANQKYTKTNKMVLMK